MSFTFLRGQRDSFQGARQEASRGRSILLFFLNNGILIALLVELAIFSIASPTIFFSTSNLITILRLASLAGILVACYTCALIAGQIDLSTAYVGSLAAVIFAILFQIAAWPLAVAWIAALVLAGAIGWFNSWLICRVGVPSLIATLAVGTLCYGIGFFLADIYGRTQAIMLVRPPLRSVVNTAFFGVPITIYLMFLIYLVVYALLNHTRVGAHLYALGGNPQAALLNGIPTTRLVRLVLVLTAVSSGMVSIFLSGRQLSAGPVVSALGASQSGALAAPASPLVAALFAGVSLSGGSGKVERTLFGVLFLAVLTIGMAILNLPVFIRILVEGLAFVLAILLDSIRQQIEMR